MRILITGSSGLLGSTIAEQLSKDHEPVGVDIVPGAWTQYIASVSNWETMFRLVKGMDAVIHTASLHAPHRSSHSRDAFIETNVIGTLNLLEAAVQANVQRFVYTSTTSLYGRAMVSGKQAVWVREDLQPLGRDIYDFTKLSAEALCQHCALTEGLPTICLRVARFFPEPPPLMALYRLYRGVDVRDAAKAHVLAVTDQSIRFDVFNVSARSPFLVCDMPALLTDVQSVLWKRIPEALQVFAQRGWDLPLSIDRVYVIEKAERHLNYHPTYNFREYIQELDAVL